MTMVTLTSRFLASASAPATMVLTAARSMYFLAGRSLPSREVAKKKTKKARKGLFMRGMLPTAGGVCQSKGWEPGNVGERENASRRSVSRVIYLQNRGNGAVAGRARQVVPRKTVFGTEVWC